MQQFNANYKTIPTGFCSSYLVYNMVNIQNELLRKKVQLALDKSKAFLLTDGKRSGN